MMNAINDKHIAPDSYRQRHYYWGACALVIMVWMSLMFQVIQQSNVSISSKISPQPFGVFRVNNENGLLVMDLASHFNFVRQLWKGDLPHPYTAEGQRLAMRAWVGEIPSGVLIHGYSPTYALLFAPLAHLPRGWGYGIYSTANLLLLIWALLPFIQQKKSLWRYLSVFGFCLSHWLLITVCVGQTCVWTTTCLMVACLQTFNDPEGKAFKLQGVMLFLLTAKPPLAIVLAGLLFAWRRWKALFYGGGITLAAWLVMSPLYGGFIPMLTDYAHLLTHYSRDAQDSIFYTSIGNSSSLVTALGSWPCISPLSASRICSMCWLFAILWLGRKKTNADDILQSIACSIGAYMLFCPNVMFTEAFAWVMIAVLAPVKNRVWEITLVILMLWVANQNPPNVFLFANQTYLFPFAFIANLLLTLYWYFASLVSGH